MMFVRTSETGAFPASGQTVRNWIIPREEGVVFIAFLGEVCNDARLCLLFIQTADALQNHVLGYLLSYQRVLSVKRRPPSGIGCEWLMARIDSSHEAGKRWKMPWCYRPIAGIVSPYSTLRNGDS
jgi:hypothetical protein